MGLGIEGRTGWLVLRESAPVARALDFSSWLNNEERGLSDASYCSLARILAAAGVIMVDDRIGFIEREDKEISNFCRAAWIRLRIKD